MIDEVFAKGIKLVNKEIKQLPKNHNFVAYFEQFNPKFRKFYLKWGKYYYSTEKCKLISRDDKQNLKNQIIDFYLENYGYLFMSKQESYTKINDFFGINYKDYRLKRILKGQKA